MHKNSASISPIFYISTSTWSAAPDTWDEFRAEDDRVSTVMCSGLWLSHVFPVKIGKPVNTSIQRITASFLQPADTTQNLCEHRPDSPGCLLLSMRAGQLWEKTLGVLWFWEQAEAIKDEAFKCLHSNYSVPLH